MVFTDCVHLLNKCVALSFPVGLFHTFTLLSVWRQNCSSSSPLSTRSLTWKQTFSIKGRAECSLEAATLSAAPWDPQSLVGHPLLPLSQHSEGERGVTKTSYSFSCWFDGVGFVSVDCCWWVVFGKDSTYSLGWCKFAFVTPWFWMVSDGEAFLRTLLTIWAVRSVFILKVYAHHERFGALWCMCASCRAVSLRFSHWNTADQWRLT